MALTTEAIERLLVELARLIREDEALSDELRRSADTFFRGAPPGPGADGTGVAEALLAARRHLEWFLVEHHSSATAGMVAEALAERLEGAVGELRASEEPLEQEAGEAIDAGFRSMLRSHTGIFEVEGVTEGAGAWLRDVTGFGSYALASVGLAATIKPGDLVVGRLYPAGESVHAASPSAAIVRGGEVARAVQRDIDEIRANSGGKVLRVSQGELEAMFFGAGDRRIEAPPADQPAAPGETITPAARSTGDPVRDARAILDAAGFGAARAKSALARLAREPRDPGQLLHGTDDVLREILDEIAFETDIDLERARAALLRAWECISAHTQVPVDRAPPPTPTPEVTDEEAARQAAIDAFAKQREAGGDPAALVDKLQRDLGIEGAAETTEKEAPAPDFPGVVGAMIDEMTWELGATEPDFDPESLEPLKHLARFARPIGVFEELTGDDLFRFATFWLQETRALDSDAEARTLVTALRRFVEWSLDAHEVDLGSQFLDALDGLEESLPRARRANEALGGDARNDLEDAAAIGELFEVESVGDAATPDFETSDDRVLNRSGDPVTVVFDDALRPHLQPGDRVRAEIALMGHATVHCCYPPESRALAR